MTRPSITLELRPNPGVDATRAVRALLKVALRRYGLKCTAIRCDPGQLEPARKDGIADIRTHACESGGER